jgi:uncharacterized membrane protein YkoI
MSPQEKAAVLQAKVTLRQAIAIAEQEIPDGLVVDADAATVRGRVAYAIEVLKSGGLHEVQIDMADGRVRRVVQRRIHPKDWNKMAAVERAGLNLQGAISVAEQNLSGGTLIAADVTTSQGKPTWDINLEKDGLHSVFIDPATGSVLKVRRHVR